jgi:hypothetical protein
LGVSWGPNDVETPNLGVSTAYQAEMGERVGGWGIALLYSLKYSVGEAKTTISHDMKIYPLNKKIA